MALKRALDLPSTILYGIGVIIGAGIYSLIGVGAGLSGDLLPIAFIGSAAVAFFTAMSYSELTSLFPKEAAEYHFAKKAFKRDWISFMVGWSIVISAIFFAATVAEGFAGYLASIFPIEKSVAAPALILFMGAVNYLGIRLSSLYNDFCAVVSVLGLLLVAVAGFLYSSPNLISFDISPESAPGLLAAAAVIFFAFVGFENLANISEEVKDSRKNLPLAILISLAISTLLYVLVSIASLKVATATELASSSAPLALVASRSLGSSVLLSVIALFATSNTVLIALISGSRIFYGISKAGALPARLSATGRTGVPTLSVELTAVAAATVAFFIDIGTSAKLTNIGLFIAYVAVNLALIALKDHGSKAAFTSPRLMGFPIFALLGAVSSLAFLAYLSLELWPYILLLLSSGAAIFFLMHKK